VVEREVTTWPRRWWFVRSERRKTVYELLAPVPGYFPWQLITAAHDKATLLAWLYGYHSGRRADPTTEDQ
jgi:hypothetical protein